MTTADTEIAVEALVAVIDGFNVDDTVEALGALAQSARSAQQSLTEDLDALDAAAQALLALMEEQDGRLLEETEDAVEAMTASVNGAEQQADDMRTAAEETAGALEALESAGELLAVNLVDQLVTRTDEPAEKLATQVDEAAVVMDQRLVALFQAIREVAAHELDGARKGIIESFGERGRSATLGQAQRLSRLVEEWAGRVAGGADKMRKKTLVPAAAHPATAAAAMMEKGATEHREAFEALMPLLDSVNGLLAELQADFDRVDRVLAEQVPELLPAIQELETVLTTAVRELETSSTFLEASLRLR